jgi:hypothetical protein
MFAIGIIVKKRNAIRPAQRLMSTVPFTMTTHNGFAEVNGLLRLEDSALYVDYEIADSITGILKTSVKVAIPQSQIADADYKNGLIGGKIRIRVKEMDELRDIPWRIGAEFMVKVKRRDRDDASQFAEELAWLLD